MEFIFLGTSAGCPTKHRNMTALALKQDQGSSWYLIDAGEGTQQQVLKTSLSLYKLKHIFITHMHGDHIFGLPGLLCSRNMSGCLDPIHIYGPQGIKGFILSALGPSQCHPEYDIIFHEITKDRESFEVDDFKIKVIQLSHNITSYAYSFQEAEHIGKLDTAKAQAFGIPAGPLYGDLKNGKSITLENGNTITPSQVIGPNIKGRRFIIGGDNDSPGLLVPELKNCDLPKDIGITVVMGVTSPYLESVSQKTKSLPFNVKIESNATNMAELMANSDVATLRTRWGTE